MSRRATERISFATLVIAICLQCGCGTILKGRAQSVRISSEPSGAKVEAITKYGTREGNSPTELLISRRRPHWAVVRATKEGYHSACRIIEVKADPLLLALDIIPAAIPLLIDVVIGRAWPGDYPSPVQVSLDPLPAGYVDVLPAAPALLDAFANNRINFCDPSPSLKQWMNLRSRYSIRAAQIVVSSGELSRPYDIVGRVDANAAGIDYFTFSYWRLGSFGTFDFRRYQHKEDLAGMNELLKFKAFELFGDSFDAIVNAHYEDMPANAVAAGGIAVRFRSAGTEPTPMTGEARLLELKRLLDNGLISREEFDRKRSQILNEL